MNGSLKAAIFDVDGTLAETEREGHRVAFNRAFEKAGLPDVWDPELYGELLEITGGRERILHYFTTRRQAAPENPEELAAELHRAKVAEFEALLKRGELDARPGILRLFSELDAAGVSRAVATTGTRSAILALLEGLDGRGAEGFAAVFTAEEAPVKKPDPQVYDLTLEALGIGPSEALAIEDSRNGLLAAMAAGIPCLVTVSDYNVAQDFSEADLVVGSLGEPEEPAPVLSDPHGVADGSKAVVNMELLRVLHRRATQASLR